MNLRLGMIVLLGLIWMAEGATPENSPEAQAKAKNLEGLSLFQAKRFGQAMVQFQRAIELTHEVSLKPYLLFNLAASQFEASFLDEASQTLVMIQPDSLETDTRAKFHTLRGRLWLKQGLNRDSAREFLEASSLLGEERGRSASLILWIEQALQNIDDLPALEVLLEESGNSPLRDLLMFRIANRALLLGKTDRARELLRQVVRQVPTSSQVVRATELLRSIESQQEVEGSAVGVLLPLSGKYAPLGQRMLRTVLNAAEVFQEKGKGRKYRWVVQDTGEDAQQAVKALESLVYQEKVIAVLGPLLSRGIDAVTTRATELGVPLLSLAQQEGFNGEWIFPLGMTPAIQARSLARVAVGQLNIKRFAILHPKDKAGEQAAQKFWDEVELLGGSVTAIESYPAGETDFRQWIDRLVSLYYPDARKREIQALEHLRAQMKITKKTRKTEEYFQIKPIVDFEAVFIPDEPKVVGQIIPMFAYRDVDHMQFLGTAAWHSTEIIERAGAVAEGSLVVDALHAASEKPNVVQFVTQYKTDLDEEPGSLEALGHDAVGYLLAALREGAKTRSELKDQLRGMEPYAGVSGSIQFDKATGVLRRGLPILKIKKGLFEEVKNLSE